MVTLDQLRDITMSFPGVQQGPAVPAARRIMAFKVAGKSFLGVEKGAQTITLSLSQHDAKAIAASHPDAHEEIWRNDKFMGLRLDLSRISSREIRNMIELSWRHSTPSASHFDSE